MKIAVTSPNAKTIAGHAGKCPGYLVFEVENKQIVSKTHIKLTREQTFRNFSGLLSESEEHPLKGINIFITQSLGEGLSNRLTQDGINIHITSVNEPEQVVQSLLETL